MLIDELVRILKSRYGVNFRQDDSNHWRVEIITGRGRSQVVYLIYKEQIRDGTPDSRLIAESPIGPLLRRFNPEVVLRKNSVLDVGAICVNDLRNEENMVVSYLTLRASHLIVTLDIEELVELIEKVGQHADDLEDEIFGKDFH